MTDAVKAGLAAGVQGYSVPMEKTVIFSSHLSADEVLELIPEAVPLIGYYKGKLELSYAATPTQLGFGTAWRTGDREARGERWNVVKARQKCWIILGESIACNHRPAHIVNADDAMYSKPEYIGDWVSRPRKWCINQDYTMNPATGDYWVIEKPAYNSPASAFMDYAMKCIDRVEYTAAAGFDIAAQEVVASKHPLAQIQIDSARRSASA